MESTEPAPIDPLSEQKIAVAKFATMDNFELSQKESVEDANPPTTSATAADEHKTDEEQSSLENQPADGNVEEDGRAADETIDLLNDSNDDFTQTEQPEHLPTVPTAASDDMGESQDKTVQQSTVDELKIVENAMEVVETDVDAVVEKPVEDVEAEENSAKEIADEKLAVVVETDDSVEMVEIDVDRNAVVAENNSMLEAVEAVEKSVEAVVNVDRNAGVVKSADVVETDVDHKAVVEEDNSIEIIEDDAVVAVEKSAEVYGSNVDRVTEKSVEVIKSDVDRNAVVAEENLAEIIVDDAVVAIEKSVEVVKTGVDCIDAVEKSVEVMETDVDREIAEENSVKIDETDRNAVVAVEMSVEEEAADLPTESTVEASVTIENLVIDESANVLEESTGKSPEDDKPTKSSEIVEIDDLDSPPAEKIQQEVAANAPTQNVEPMDTDETLQPPPEKPKPADDDDVMVVIDSDEEKDNVKQQINAASDKTDVVQPFQKTTEILKEIEKAVASISDKLGTTVELVPISAATKQAIAETPSVEIVPVVTQSPAAENNDVIMLDDDDDDGQIVSKEKPLVEQPAPIAAPPTLPLPPPPLPQTPPPLSLPKAVPSKVPAAATTTTAATTRECVNFACGQKSTEFFRASNMILSHFKATKKITKWQYVCADCNEEAIVRYEQLTNVLLAQQPILLEQMPNHADHVEILDSSDEEETAATGTTERSKKIKKRFDETLELDVVNAFKADFETVLAETLANINIDQQMSWSRQILDHKIDKNAAASKEISADLRDLQRMADSMYKKLYQTTSFIIEDLPPLDLNTMHHMQVAGPTYPPFDKVEFAPIDTNSLYYCVRQKLLSPWVPSKVTEIIDAADVSFVGFY